MNRAGATLTTAGGKVSIDVPPAALSSETCSAQNHGEPKVRTSPRGLLLKGIEQGELATLAQAGDRPLRRRAGLDGARRAGRSERLAPDHGSLLRDSRVHEGGERCGRAWNGREDHGERRGLHDSPSEHRGRVGWGPPCRRMASHIARRSRWRSETSGVIASGRGASHARRASLPRPGARRGGAVRRR